MHDNYDVLIIGGGPGGYVAAIRISGKTTSGRHLPELGMHANQGAVAWR